MTRTLVAALLLLQALAAPARAEPAVGFWGPIRSLLPDEPHTLKDLPAYLESNLGAGTLARLRAGGQVHILEGDGREALARLRAEGWRVGGRIRKAAGFHDVHVIRRDGVEALAISRVNGRDRILHIQSLLRLAGARARQVVTVRGYRSWKGEYLETFHSLGHKPDLVVYGLTWSAADYLLGELGGGSHEVRQLFSASARKRGRNDISDRSMKVIEYQNGRRVWLFPPVYGEIARDLMEALAEHGARGVLFLGTAGAVQPRFSVGDWISPALVEAGSGRRAIGLEPIPGLEQAGTYLNVPTPNLETRRWLQRKTVQRADVVDVELGHVLPVLRAHPELHARAAFVISDVLQGPHHTDLTEKRVGELPGVGQGVRRCLRSLGLTRARGFLPVASRSVPFGGGGRR
jgi:hypothetical protein